MSSKETTRVRLSFACKSTGKPRDAETGLDDFGFRYNSSTLGRWMTPDPAGNLVASPANPQSWNQYAYVLNNPNTWTDPNGLETWTIGDCHYDTVAFSVDGQFQGFDTELLGCDPSNENNAGYSSGVSNAPAPQIKVDCSQGAVPPPPSPPGVNLAGNVQRTQSQVDAGISLDMMPATDGINGSGMIGPFSTWLSRVRPFGAWDYKEKFGLRYAAFGNFNYGATCNAIGLSLTGCQRGAGSAAYLTAIATKAENAGSGPWTAGLGNPLGSPSAPFGVPDYGDQQTPTENQAVIAGWVYQEWHNQCRN